MGLDGTGRLYIVNGTRRMEQGELEQSEFPFSETEGTGRAFSPGQCRPVVQGTVP